jgi:sirohydrochlorin cobaltochelatase
LVWFFLFSRRSKKESCHETEKDPEHIEAHPEIPEDILHVKTPLATLADMQNAGNNNIVLQPTHVSMGEEFILFCSIIKATRYQD